MQIAPKIADFNIVDINTEQADVQSSPGLAGVAVIQQGKGQGLQTYYSLDDVAGDYDNNSYAYKAASNYFDNPNATTFQVISYPSGNGNAVKALTKYYKSGAEFFIFEVASQADQQTAVALSNLVEGQQNGMLFLDQPTQAIGTDDDFKWYQPIVNNRSTVLFSMPYSGDPSGYQFVPNILSRYAGGNPSSNLELTNNLPNIEPQDYYNFTDQDFQVYQKNGVITYCYRNDIPMLSSGNSASRYQVSNMITRDYLNSQISHGISGAIIQAHNDGKDIKFDQNGVNYIVSIIRMTLSSSVQAGYIKNPVVHGVDANKIPENVKEEGYLNGLSYDWAPNNNINKVTFHQVINVPLMASK